MKQIIIVKIIVSMCFLFSLSGMAQAADIKVKNLIAVKISDWNKDGFMDKAVLALPRNRFDYGAVLYIYLSGKKNKTVLRKKNIAWFGAMWGTVPKLSINRSGSLIVHSMNEAVGRNRWSKKLTISYRKKQFIVSGYSYSSYDTLKRNSHSECDVNLLTGKGKKNGKYFRFKVRKRTLKTWTDKQIPTQCA